MVPSGSEVFLRLPVGELRTSNLPKFSPSPIITPKPHFGKPFSAKPIIERALRKSHVNGATKLKLYRYRQVLGVCHNVFPP